jgi:hypothetical protein
MAELLQEPYFLLSDSTTTDQSAASTSVESPTPNVNLVP